MEPIKCKKCGCSAFKPLDNDYSMCFECGELYPLTIEVMPMPPKFVPPPRKEFCIKGHARTPENVTSRGACKVCQKIRDAARTLDPQYKAYQKAYRGKSISGVESIVFGKGM